MNHRVDLADLMRAKPRALKRLALFLDRDRPNPKPSICVCADCKPVIADWVARQLNNGAP